ncbi:MAG: hypothetical protein VYE77_05700 [Planctomycetota bacterium]|nr:hypothetical protein [Planctomycetota bacterium]
MRRLPYVVWAWLLVPVGCLEMDQTITIAKDGSGTQEVVMVLPAETMDEVKRAASVNHIGARIDPGALFDKETVGKELAAAGLELKQHETESLEQGRKVSMTVGFASCEELSQSPLVGSMAEWDFAPGPVKDSIELSFYPQGRLAWGQARAQAAKMKGTLDPVAADYFQKRRQQLNGLDVTLRFRLPGAVLRYTRNMEQTGLNEVTATVTSAQIRTPEDLVRRLAPRYQVVFVSKDCTIKTAR